jgi:hypothetical protein
MLHPTRMRSSILTIECLMNQAPDPREAVFDAILISDVQLRLRWRKEPHVFVQPDPAAPSKKFLMIWVCIGEESFSLSAIWSLLDRIVRLGRDNLLFSGVVGGEIIPTLLSEGNGVPERVLRLSFFSRSIEALLDGSPSSLLKGDLIPGEVRCTWYLPPPPMELRADVPSRVS